MPKKGFEEVAPRSARTAAPIPAAVLPASGVMRLDDLSADDARTAHVTESLERVVLPPAEEEVATPPAPSVGAPPRPAPPAVQPHKRMTKMIATPIDSELRARLRDLRNYEISEAFVLETALRAFFADRPVADIAADLRARGGRLRRAR
jgi:hypothetical protein